MVTTTSDVLAARVLPRNRVAILLAMLGFAALTALAAQVSFYVPPIEVPFTLQTLVVLLAGGVLGSAAGAGSQLLYVAAGAVGAPVFAEGSAGFRVLVGPTGGYLVGFVVAAWVVGRLAERRNDRRLLTSLSTFVVGNLVIYAFGVAGLMGLAGLDLGTAVAHGVVPFVFWDLAKALAAGAALPLAWRVGGDR